MVNGSQPLNIFAKSFVIDVWQGSKYLSTIKTLICSKSTMEISKRHIALLKVTVTLSTAAGFFNIRVVNKAANDVI